MNFLNFITHTSHIFIYSKYINIRAEHEIMFCSNVVYNENLLVFFFYILFIKKCRIYSLFEHCIHQNIYIFVKFIICEQVQFFFFFFFFKFVNLMYIYIHCSKVVQTKYFSFFVFFNFI